MKTIRGFLINLEFYEDREFRGAVKRKRLCSYINVSALCSVIIRVLVTFAGDILYNNNLFTDIFHSTGA